MAKDQSRLGKFFQKLFRRNDVEKIDQEAEKISSEYRAEMVENAPEEKVVHQPDEIVIAQGALWEIWHKWKEGQDPPVLKMGGRDTPLPLSDSGLKEEHARLMMALEWDAKKRLEQLAQCEGQEGKALPPMCQVYPSGDKMVAWAFIFPPSDPEQKFSSQQIGEAMQKYGVTTGVDSAAIAYLFQEHPYFELVPIAYGTPVIEGEPGRIEEHFPREVKPEVKINEDGMADYRTSNYVQLINKGDVICDIIEPKEGTAGVQIDGVVLEAKPVHMDKIPKGSHTVLSEDGKQLIAAQDGHLQLVDGLFHVRPVLEIKSDVDYSTGNVDFNGDVHIVGDVRENFSVRATGTITIDGLVEAAVVEAGGDLVIASGVLGNYKAVLKSAGCVRVKYLENCVVYASKGIYADCIMTSQIFSDDTIQVTTGRGTIIGGELVAAHTVYARLIGSQAGRKTAIKLGAMPCAEEERRSNQAELESIQKEMKTLDTSLKDLVENQGIAGSNEALSKAQLRKSMLSLKEMQLTKRRAKMEFETPDLMKCRLEAGVVYPITQVSIGIDRMTVDTKTNNCKMKYDAEQGEIQLI